METIKKIDTLSAMLVITLIALGIYLWSEIAAPGPPGDARAYFLNVTQGDAELVIFPGDIKMMIDAGSDAKVVNTLQKVVSPNDAYIDLAVISEPVPENITGFNYLLDHYRIGVFLYSGRGAVAQQDAWRGLLLKIKSRNIPLITVGAGDRIRFAGSAAGNAAEVLSPDNAFRNSPDPDDAGLVLRVVTPHWKALFTGNIGHTVEHFLLSVYPGFMKADILKIARHGSIYSSEKDFLAAVDPKIAVIETAAKGTAGQPSKETLARIASSTHAVILETGQKGIIDIGYDILKKRVNIVSKQ